mgnify:CR=1 FL=1
MTIPRIRLLGDPILRTRCEPITKPRSTAVRVQYQDIKGETHEVDLEGDRAELLQHEIDHLDGVLAVDRPHGLDPFCLREEWNRQHAAKGRYGEPLYLDAATTAR